MWGGIKSDYKNQDYCVILYLRDKMGEIKWEVKNAIRYIRKDN